MMLGSLVLLIFASAGTIDIVSPTDGNVVPLMSSGQREFLSLDSAGRRALFETESGRKHLAELRDRPLPVRLGWTVEGSSNSLLQIRQGARVVLMTNVVGRGSLELWNLRSGAEYDCEIGTDGNCARRTFRTENGVPRLIRIPGVPNVRDCGGWKTRDGRRVRQGLVYRSAGLNENARNRTVEENGKQELVPYEKGADRLDDSSRTYVTDVLGIKCDIDLRRTYLECYGMTGSPLGEKVRWRNVTMKSYDEIRKPEARDAFAKIFRLFLDESNYPIVFHCIAGKDRTGTVAFLIGGLLGVSLDDLEKDWQLSAFQGRNAERMDHAARFDRMVECLRRTYGGEDVNAMVEKYVRSLGFSAEDIRRFRDFMLEPATAGSACGEESDRLEGFERMKFNNPGLEVDLGIGLWGRPRVYDYDGDGLKDLLLGSRQWMLFYRNPGLPEDAMPVFDVGVQIDKSTIRDPSEDRSFNEPSEPAYDDKSCVPSWSYCDLDGDGRKDAVCVICDKRPYGGTPGPRCPVAYHADGSWAKGMLELHLFWYRNEGGEGKRTVWGPPQPIPVGDGGNVMYGPCGGHYNTMVSDWDGDGDFDIIIGEFVDTFWYFENVGGCQVPRFAKGRPVAAASGRPLAVDLCMFRSRMVDWDGDGLVDIIASDEDTRTAFYRNLGRTDANHTPVFADGRYFRQKADNLKFGCLAVPDAVDWDGDGDQDFIAGNSAGYIAFIENLSGPGVARPKWAEPKLMSAGGKTIRTMAGMTGSPQGPAERKWGYSGVSVADWDGDGILDVMSNDINGDVLVYRGRRKGSLDLMPAEHVEVEWSGPQPLQKWEWRGDPGKALRAPWRVAVEMVDWNRDGLPDLMTLDHEGYLCLYPRAERNGRRILLPPQRIFCDADGKPLRLNPREGGASGRRRFCTCDWNGDGLRDFILDGYNGTPYLQVGEKDGKFLFRNWNSLGGKRLAGHTCAPCVVDFDGNGIDDYVGAAEDGFFYYLENPRSWEKRQPKETTVLAGERAFDGSTGFRIPDSDRLVPYFGDFTITLDVRTTNRSGRQSVFSSLAEDAKRGKGGMPDIGIGLNAKRPGVPYFVVSPLVRMEAKTDVADGQWHRLEVRRKGTDLSLAVDGHIEATGTADYPFFPIVGWAIGSSVALPDEPAVNPFTGAVRTIEICR